MGFVLVSGGRALGFGSVAPFASRRLRPRPPADDQNETQRDAPPASRDECVLKEAERDEAK